MTPIRIGIIGLSASAKTSWASGAHLPYLLSQARSSTPKYQIVALCNSSEQAARSAISTYKLDPSTKAYGSPEDLAKDPDVDLVVVSTRVDVHYNTILPSLKAGGKNVYVEWPLAENAARAAELVDLAKKSGVNAMVGLQGRLAPPVVKIKEVLASGKIGTVLSSEIRASGGTNDREKVPDFLQYFVQKEVGGNVVTIGFAHLFDLLQHTLGEFTDIHTRLHIQRPQVPIRKSDNTISQTVTSDVPDLLLLTATISGAPHAKHETQRNAPVSIRFRKGQPFKSEPPLVWTISGTKGELRLTNNSSTSLGAAGYSPEPPVIEVYDFETEGVEKVDWEWKPWQEELPVPGRSVARLYEEFAKGAEGEWPTFEDAGNRHNQLKAMFDEWEKTQSV